MYQMIINLLALIRKLKILSKVGVMRNTKGNIDIGEGVGQFSGIKVK